MKSTHLSFFLILFLITSLVAQSDESQVYKQYSTGKFFEILKPYQSTQYAVGIQAKGKLANVITNSGQLGQFHVYTPALNWPAFGEGQDDEQHYGWGVDFMMGYNGDVIESFRDPASNLISREWQQADENLFSGNVTVSESDLTPLMATSDNKETWPIGDDGIPFWPGIFRKDKTGQVYPGEFTSERDLFCVYTDRGNDSQYGFRVELTAYSFTRRYAEDFLVYRFNIKNTSQDTLKNIYPGMMIQFLIDFDDHDLINFVDSNNDGKQDFIYMWDEDQTPLDPWSKVGYIGLLTVKSPNPDGITNFHYFHDDFIPSQDEYYWTMLTSDDSQLPDTTRSKYFHGSDKYIDDVSLAPALDPDGNNKGGEISWIYSMGPITLNPADSAQMEIAIICGDNEQDLLDNAEWVWILADNGWSGSNPPMAPEARAFAGDGKVTITWNSLAENSTDNITGLQDFEGYKIYRSTDHGKTWGKEITDSRGDFRSFQPLAQFDLKNEINGNDPISNSYLGNDSGIQHSFIDSTVTNGIEYWYAVTAYDGGDPANKVESLESALGLTTDEINIASAIPVTKPSNYNNGYIEDGNTLVPDSSFTDGTVSIEIIDPTKLKDRNFKITFNDSTKVIVAQDSFVYQTTFNLMDMDAGQYIFENQILTDESGDNIPVTDGFRLSLINTEPGLSSIGWSKVSGDTCTFDWYTHRKTDSFQEADEYIIGFDDYKIVVVDTSDGSLVTLTDGLFGHVFHSIIKIPIKVYQITDPDNPVEISEFTEVFDLKVQFPSSELLGPLGWDLIPGGAGFNPTGTADMWPDILALNTSTDESGSALWLKTQNGPDTETPPSIGDEFEIHVSKPFREGVVYTFSTKAGSVSSVKKEYLDKIRVVPNPFFVSNSIDNRIMFTNLPDQCEISIYNVAGDKVHTFNHSSEAGIAYWNLENDQGLAIAYGLYIYVVKADNGEKQVGKFSIIR